MFSANIISAEVEVTSEQKLLAGNLIILKGNPGSEIIAEKNHFAGRLSIENPFYVSIMNNRFVLDSDITHSETAATYFEGNNIQSIIFSDNLITAPANRGNFLFQFDNTAGIIDSLTVGNNSMNGSKNPTPYYMKETQKIIRNFVHEPGETGSKDIKKGPG